MRSHGGCRIFTFPIYTRDLKRREGQRNWKEKEKEEREGQTGDQSPNDEIQPARDAKGLRERKEKASRNWFRDD